MGETGACEVVVSARGAVRACALLAGLWASGHCEGSGPPCAIISFPLETVGDGHAGCGTLGSAVQEWMGTLRDAGAFDKAGWYLSDFGALDADTVVVNGPGRFRDHGSPAAVFESRDGEWALSYQFEFDGILDYQLASSTIVPTRSTRATAYRLADGRAVQLEVPEGLWRLCPSETGAWVGIGPAGLLGGTISDNAFVVEFAHPVPDDMLDDASQLGVAWLHDDTIAIVGSMWLVDMEAGTIDQVSMPDDADLAVYPCGGCELGRDMFLAHGGDALWAVTVDQAGQCTDVQNFGLPAEQVLLSVDPTGEWAVAMTLDNPIFGVPSTLHLYQVSGGRLVLPELRAIQGRMFLTWIPGCWDVH